MKNMLDLKLFSRYGTEEEEAECDDDDIETYWNFFEALLKPLLYSGDGIFGVWLYCLSQGIQSFWDMKLKIWVSFVTIRSDKKWYKGVN